MHETPDDHDLAELLPGSWTVAATNLPLWLSGAGRDVRLSYELVSSDPLVLATGVSYRTPEDAEKSIVGRDTWRHDGFVRRGSGLRRMFTSRWTVSGTSEDGTVLAARYRKSRSVPAGVDVMVREGTDHPELRAMVARSTERFGLTPEDFASLSWLAPGPES